MTNDAQWEMVKRGPLIIKLIFIKKNEGEEGDGKIKNHWR